MTGDVVTTWDGGAVPVSSWRVQEEPDAFQLALAEALLRPLPDHPDRQGLPEHPEPHPWWDEERNERGEPVSSCLVCDLRIRLPAGADTWEHADALLYVPQDTPAHDALPPAWGTVPQQSADQDVVDALVGYDGPRPWPGDRLRAGLSRVAGELRRCLPYLVMLAGAAATVLTSTGWRGGVVLMVLGATVAITAEVRSAHHWLAHELVEAAVQQQLAQREQGRGLRAAYGYGPTEEAR